MNADGRTQTDERGWKCADGSARMHGQKNRLTEGRTDADRRRRTDERERASADGWTDGQTDRLPDMHSDERFVRSKDDIFVSLITDYSFSGANRGKRTSADA